MLSLWTYLMDLWRRFVAWLEAPPAPPPDPDPPPILSVAYWLARLAETYPAEYTKHYSAWEKNARYYIYFYGSLIRTLGCAWLAAPEDHTWLEEALRWVKLAQTGIPQSNLYWMVGDQAVVWLLDIMQARGVADQYRAEWDAALAYSVEMWDTWKYTPSSSNTMGHVLAVGHYLSKLDPARATEYRAWIAYAVKGIPAQYAKYPDGIWHVNDEAGIEDTSHAQHEIEVAAMMLAEGVWDGGPLAYLERALWRVYDPATGQFAELVDGSGVTDTQTLWGWAFLGALSVHHQQALEKHDGRLYKSFWYGVMAWNAALLGAP